MSFLKLYVTCVWCRGTGIANSRDEQGNPVIEDPCTACGGTGYYETGTISGDVLDDIVDKLDDVLDKCKDIFEKVSE